MTPPSSIHLAVSAYLIAQMMPAFRLGVESMQGGYATFLSFFGTLAVLDPNGPRLPEAAFIPACLAGASANLLFVSAVIAGYCRTRRLALMSSVAALVGAAIAVGSLIGAERPFDPQTGCFIWLGAMGWLAFRTAFPSANLVSIPMNHNLGL